MKIGVLALQGDFREHIAAVKSAGHAGLTVRRPEELAEVDALILPGGESTTIVHLAKTFNLMQPIRDRIKLGMPVYGSCAGMILLADRIIPLSAGPGATLGAPVQVQIARPRDRKKINHEPRFKEIRKEVNGYLLGLGTKPKLTLEKKFVLPAIEPEDLDHPRNLIPGASLTPIRSNEVKRERVEV